MHRSPHARIDIQCLKRGTLLDPEKGPNPKLVKLRTAPGRCLEIQQFFQLMVGVLVREPQATGVYNLCGASGAPECLPKLVDALIEFKAQLHLGPDSATEWLHFIQNFAGNVVPLEQRGLHCR